MQTLRTFVDGHMGEGEGGGEGGEIALCSSFLSHSELHILKEYQERCRRSLQHDRMCVSRKGVGKGSKEEKKKKEK